jgi:hypothetical protein
MKRVLGLEHDGSTVAMTIGRTQIPLTAAAYGDNISPEKLRMMGSQKIDAITPGTYDTDDGSIKMPMSVFRAEFAPLMDQYGFGNRPLPIVFSFTHPDTGSDSDLLEECRILGIKEALENTNKPNEVEFKFMTRQIRWTDRRITINAQDTAEPLGQSAF